MKKVILADRAGYCFGVSRSVKLAEEALSGGQSRCYCMGELIHNTSVVEKLCEDGLVVINSPEELPLGETVIVRAHGISKSVYDTLAARAGRIIDATCPDVKKIHNAVIAAEAEGRMPVIIGAEHHPEVEAIRGQVGNALVFSDAKSLENWLMSSPNNRDAPLSIVFQTTQTQNNRDEIEILQKKLCTNVQMFDTICSATSIRQREAEKLARSCEAMVVIGGKHSANSIHLAEIVSKYCDKVQFISSVDELDLKLMESVDTLGITAGASTPQWIIKEVKQTMTDEIKVEDTIVEQETTAEQEITETEAVAEVEMTFDQMLEESIKTIYNGDTVTGIVAAVTPTEISVDLGTKHSGYIPVSEYTDDTDTDINDLIKIGDSIEACVVRVNDVEGTVMLSKKRLDAIKTWVVVEEAVDNGTILEGVVTEENKGGVVVSVKGIRVFVPASQTGLPKDAEMSEILKQKVRLKIKEVNRGRRRVVGSIRDVQRDERRERSDKIWNDIEVGKQYAGVVKSLTNYGAFVDIGGIDGMVHVSELSWSRIKQPADVLTVGQEVSVYVIGFDKENRKISLGYKDPNGNPWVRFMDTYKVGDVIGVSIVKLMPFGAFAELLPGVDGLIHISQIADRRIGKPDEVLSVGETVDAKITAIDTEKQKISLSIRAISEPDAPAADEVVEEKVVEPEADALVYEVSEDGTAAGNLPVDNEAPVVEAPVETVVEEVAETPVETSDEAPVETPVETPDEAVSAE